MNEFPSLKEFEDLRRFAFSDTDEAPDRGRTSLNPYRPQKLAMSEERLRRSSRSAGVASRRKAEQMITEGRVTVNGTIITELGSKADLERDHIKVDGKLLHAARNDWFTSR